VPPYPISTVLAAATLVLTLSSAAPQNMLAAIGPTTIQLQAGMLGHRAPDSELESFFQWVRDYIPPEAVVIWLPDPFAIEPSDTQNAEPWPFASIVSNRGLANYYLRPRELLAPGGVTAVPPPGVVDGDGTCRVWDQRRDTTWILQHEWYAPRCPGMLILQVLQRDVWRLVEVRSAT
jgi:hypothetical protein